MNSFSSPTLSRPSIWINDVHVGGRFYGTLSEGQLVGTLLHGLLLGDRASVLVGWNGLSTDAAHISRAKSLVAVLESSGFQVRRKFESIQVPRGPAYEYQIQWRARKPTADVPEGLTRECPFRVDGYGSLVSAVIRLHVVASELRADEYFVSVSAGMQDQALRHVGQHAASLGFRLTAYKASEKLDLRFERVLRPSLRWPMNEFLEANAWRTTTVYLNRLLPRSCDICQRSRRSLPRYRLGWCPIYPTPGEPGQLIATSGFSPLQLDDLALELGCKENGTRSERGDVLFVPASNWTTGRPLLVTHPEAGRQTFRTIAKISSPKPERGIQLTRASKAEVPGSVEISLVPLGGGQEIGANSYLLRIGARRLLLDCGLDVGDTTLNPLGMPKLEFVDHLDAILISHAHTDHIGSVLMAHTLFPSTPILATPETATLMRIMIQHHSTAKFRRMQEEELGVQLPTTVDWDEQLEKILFEVPFGEKRALPGLEGVSIEFQPAGHILGAAHIIVEVGSRRILYTGDFCTRDQLTVSGSSTAGKTQADTVITEATYGGKQSRKIGRLDDVVSQLAEILRSEVTSGGITLLPSFALGKAQEVFALVHAARARAFPAVPPSRIYVGGLAARFFPVYSRYSSGVFPSLPEPEELPEIDFDNPEAALKELRSKGFAAIIATHGMMLPGTLSHMLGLQLISNKGDAIVITGYQAPNSLGDVLDQCSEMNAEMLVYHEDLPGGASTVRARVYDLPISGHASREEILHFLTSIRPDRVVAVHGQAKSVAELLDESSRLLPASSMFGPVNLEVVSLGKASVDENTIEKWRTLRILRPVPPAAQEPTKRARRALPPWRGFFIDSDNAYVQQRKGPGVDKEFVVMIDPGSCLRANVILSPPSSVDLNQFSEVSIERRQEDGFTTVRKLSSDRLAKLTSKHIIAPIGPGTYRIKSTTAAGSVEQFLDVVLDFRPACDDWTFGADGSLTERIEILEAHLRNFDHVEVVDAHGKPVRGIEYWATPDGLCLSVHLRKTQDAPVVCYLHFYFSDSYPPSRVKLDLAAPSTPALDFSISLPVIAGVPFEIKMASAHYGLVEIKDSANSLITSATRIETDVASLVFSRPGKTSLEICARRSDGYFGYTQRDIEVSNGFTPDASIRAAQVAPGAVLSIKGKLAEAGSWEEVVLDVAGTKVSAELSGRDALFRIRAPSQPGQYPVTVAARASGWRDLERARLYQSSIVVGFGEAVEFSLSTLALGDRPALIVIDRSLPFPAERLHELETTLAPWQPVLQLEDHGKRCLISLRHSPPDAAENRQPFCDVQGLGLSVLLLDRLTISMYQGSKEVMNTTIVDPSRELRIFLKPVTIPTFEEDRTTFSAVVKVHPILEWVDLSAGADGSLGAWNLSPGEYRFVIVHQGSIVLNKPFKVAARDAATPRRACAEIDAQEECRSEDFPRIVADFLGKSGNVPPAVIGLSLRGQRVLLNKPATNLDQAFEGFLKRYAPRGLVFFVTPDNEVPRYLSDALFRVGTPWVALSYPCIRDGTPLGVSDFLQTMTLHSAKARGEMQQIRKLPRPEMRRWTPTMSVRCPTCGEALKADVGSKMWKTRCQCGFETDSVGYALYDLNEDRYRVFVLQFAMFEYLIGASRSRFGRLLGGALRCGKCGYKTPFRDAHEITSIDRRFDQARRYVRLPGDLAFFISEGWWNFEDGQYRWSSKLRIIMGGHCPTCCAGHLSFPDCATSPLVTGLGESVILLVGLEQLAFPETDPFFILSDPFPSYRYPRLDGISDPFLKITTMIRSCETWWQGR